VFGSACNAGTHAGGISNLSVPRRLSRAQSNLICRPEVAALAALAAHKIEDVLGPNFQSLSTFIGEGVALVDGGHSSQLRRLVPEEPIGDNRVDAEAREGGDASSPNVV
jgi:hypothetical protein